MFNRMLAAVRPPTPSLKPFMEPDPVLGLYVDGKGRTSPIKGDNAAIGPQMAARQASALSLTRVGLSQAYQINETVHRCVDLRASKLSNIPLRVIDKKTRKPIPDHPLLAAMDFSRQYYRKPLIRSIEYGWCLFGETYIEKVRDQYGKVRALLWLNPQAITPEVNSGGILYYQYMPNGNFSHMQTYKPEVIIYDHSYNPDDDWRGLSPVSVAMGSVNLSKFVSDYLSAYFQNDARPGGILAARGNTVLTQADQKRLLFQWTEQLGGPKNRKKTVFLPASLEWQDVQDRPASQHGELEVKADKRICRALGVPYTLVEAQEQRTDNDEDKKSLFEDTLFPRCDEIAELLQREALPYFGDPDTEMVSFDVDAVRVTYGNQVQKSTAINSQLLAGAMSINEARREYGRTDVEGGDLYLIPKNATLVNEDELGMVVEQQRAAEEKAAEDKRQQFEASMQQKKEQVGSPASGASAPQETPDERANAINLQGRNNQPAKAELAAWRRKTTRKGLKAGLRFSAEYIPDSVATFVRSQLESLPEPHEADDVRLAFDQAKMMLDRDDEGDAVDAMLKILADLGVDVV